MPLPREAESRAARARTTQQIRALPEPAARPVRPKPETFLHPRLGRNGPTKSTERP